LNVNDKLGSEHELTAPDLILRAKQHFNIDVQPRTLLNYERWGLVGKPKRKSLGRGLGRQTLYEALALEEVVVAWLFLHGKYATPDTRSKIGDLMPPLPNQFAALVKMAADELFLLLGKPTALLIPSHAQSAAFWNLADSATRVAISKFRMFPAFPPAMLRSLRYELPPITIPELSKEHLNRLPADFLDSLPFPFGHLASSYAAFWLQTVMSVRQKIETL
jgi:hypothetical protein